MEMVMYDDVCVLFSQSCDIAMTLVAAVITHKGN
jgi:hypothetical protein